MGAIRCDSFLKLPRVLASASKVKCNFFRSHVVVLLRLLWQYDGTIFIRLHYILEGQNISHEVEFQMTSGLTG